MNNNTIDIADRISAFLSIILPIIGKVETQGIQKNSRCHIEFNAVFFEIG